MRPLLLFLPLSLMALQVRSFDLQDTIHALIEENIHLHDQLENLTQALRELKQLLWNHSIDHHDDHHDNHHDDHHNEDIQHLWDEWSEHGISAETHLLLEHALCGRHSPRGTGSPRCGSLSLLTVLLLSFTTSLLAGG